MVVDVSDGIIYKMLKELLLIRKTFPFPIWIALVTTGNILFDRILVSKESSSNIHTQNSADITVSIISQ